jgi:hypothetical protein
MIEEAWKKIVEALRENVENHIACQLTYDGNRSMSLAPRPEEMPSGIRVGMLNVYEK